MIVTALWMLGVGKVVPVYTVLFTIAVQPKLALKMPVLLENLVLSYEYSTSWSWLYNPCTCYATHGYDSQAFNLTLKCQVKGRAILPKNCTAVSKSS